MTAEGAIAEVRATHIGPKKELHNPKSEAPKKTESKWKRLIQNLKKEDSSLEDCEDIKLVKISLEDAVNKVMSGEISTASTIIGLLLLDKMYRKGKL